MNTFTPHICNIISYFQQCYVSDNREEEILDIFDPKINFKYFIEKKDFLFNGLLPRVSVSGEEILEVQKTAALQKQEKKLVMGFLLCTGRILLNDTIQKICSPLWMGPARIVAGDVTPAVTLDLEEMKLNYSLLQRLESLEHPESPGEARSTVDDLAAQIPPLPVNEKRLGELMRVLGEVFPLLNLNPILEYPQQVSQIDIKKVLKKKPGQSISVSLLPASVLLLVHRSVSTRGVLSELKELKNSETLSRPLRLLLTKDGDLPSISGKAPAKKKEEKDTNYIAVPAVLSRSQLKIVDNACQKELSVVIGPPGTGKSYTIAAVAVDHLVRGESVLIASKTNQAVDVIADKIEMILGIKNFVIRGGRKQYQQELKEFIDNLLAGIIPIKTRQLCTMLEYMHLKWRLEELERILTRRSAIEQEWGEKAVRPPKGLFRKLLVKFRVLSLVSYLNTRPPYWELLHEYQDSILKRIRYSREKLQKRIKNRLAVAVEQQWEMLRDFYRAVKTFRSYHREKFFNKIDFNAIFNAFPIWMVNQTDVSNVLPLEAELFDIALIDEATQCDISSSLPIIQRARRVVIMGDPHQLRHISFLSRERQKGIAEKTGLPEDDYLHFNYRDDSLLDLARKQIKSHACSAYLDEHFRSLPPIIRFSNREFYGDSLKIMQERPKTNEKACLFFHKVKGKRNDSGVNEREAEDILNSLKQILDQQAQWSPEDCSTLGILSPFSDQVEFFSKKLTKEIPFYFIQRHALIVGTPYAFQGEERDIMLISLCLDNDSHPSSFMYLNRKDVFNVAITRARNQQMIYASFDKDNPRVKGLLSRYLSFIEFKQHRFIESEDPSRDPFLEEVGKALNNLGWNWWPNFPVAGFYVDMVVEIEGKMFGIDLIGYPGDYTASFELEQYRIFNRANFPIFPLSYHAWTRNKNKCLDALAKWFRAQFAANDMGKCI
jgi:hypothetical protein